MEGYEIHHAEEIDGVPDVKSDIVEMAELFRSPKEHDSFPAIVETIENETKNRRENNAIRDKAI